MNSDLHTILIYVGLYESDFYHIIELITLIVYEICTTE